jgi:hypothetical protein
VALAFDLKSIREAIQMLEKAYSSIRITRPRGRLCLSRTPARLIIRMEAEVPWTARMPPTTHPSLGLRSCAMVFLLQKDYEGASNFLNHYRDHYSGYDFSTSLSVDMLLRQGKEQEAL